MEPDVTLPVASMVIPANQKVTYESLTETLPAKPDGSLSVAIKVTCVKGVLWVESKLYGPKFSRCYRNSPISLTMRPMDHFRIETQAPGGPHTVTVSLYVPPSVDDITFPAAPPPQATSVLLAEATEVLEEAIPPGLH